ncbi:hypothetical protein [Xanthobacter sediminis]
MSIFDDALAAARDAVRSTFGMEMVITAMRAGDYTAGQPDPARPAYGAVGVLHEHSTVRGGEDGITASSDGSRRSGGGVDVATAPTRISFDMADLRHGIPAAGTRIDMPGAGRRFEVAHAAPPNGGRCILYVTEVAP